MARRELICKDDNGMFLGFTIGSSCSEYPDARHFHRLSDALKHARAYLTEHTRVNEVGVFEFYGLENETCIDAVWRI